MSIKRGFPEQAGDEACYCSEAIGCHIHYIPNTQPLSSGRWDASGSWSDAVFEEREKAFRWASGLDLKKLHWAVTVMASDTNAFTLYERKAVLEVIALKLGKEISDGI